MKSSENLYYYLNQKLLDSVNQKDLNNLCFSLFCTLDILPKTLQSLKITKQVLARAFLKVAIEKNVSKNSSENYWIDLIDLSIKDGKSPNIKNARILLGT